MKNTIALATPNTFDFGLVSFGTAIATLSYGLALANVQASPGKVARYMATASHVFVALNYLLGVYLAFAVRPGFGIYCVCFVGVWIGIAGWGSQLTTSSSTSVSENERLVL